MSDNRPTAPTAMERFRTALEKRGIEFETNDDECAEGEERMTLFKANLGESEFDIFVTAKDWYFDGELTPWLDVEFHNALTPEQAIAATLGNSKSTADAIAELRKVVREAFSGESVSILVEGHAIMRAIDAVEAATLGSERDEIDDAGFDSGVKATLQQLEGVIACGDGLADIEAWIDELWKEYES